ncbi:MAG: FAD-binding oxidoreductase [Planctomycetes bacterium]|nr:FAD-binding oxidoreductase [Planctomycetota bacterium]
MTAHLADGFRSVTGPGVVSDDLADRLQWSGDASIYRLVPRLVAFPRHVADVQALLALAARERMPVCFRAGGTSLSGQAVTDGMLIVVSRHLRRIRVLDGGARVAAQPGAVGAHVNGELARYGRKIGPDPASIQAAEIGGIVANNASGMCCSVAGNSYHTIAALDLVLADGFRLNTGDVDADANLARGRPELVRELLAIRDQIRADPAMSARIATAFSTKNTVGYSLNAFLDADTPARILQKLVVGSEGTLAFICDAVFTTLPLPRARATAWMLFPDVEAAGEAVAPLARAGAAAVEVLDAVSLRRVEHKLPDPIPPGQPAALLVEFQESDEAALQRRLEGAQPLLAGLPVLRPAPFTRDASLQARYWAVRKGLFPSVGAVRAAGTAVVIEDVTFPVAALAVGMRALRTLFSVHGYDDAVIFGHAKDGNLHFTLTPDFSKSAEVVRYDGFMRALVETVLAHGGHLKAEHGTGRNMAPFVEAQWGAEAVALMRRVKLALDPLGILNPGVLLNADPRAHIDHLKVLAPVDPLVDRCIECGFCEPVCPSRDVTMSPRQRIAALRLLGSGTAVERAAISRVWQHRAVDTCAADGMCATACPVDIDTGDLVKAERARSVSWPVRLAANALAGRFSAVVAGARGALALARGLGISRLPGTEVPLPGPGRALPRRWPVAGADRPTVAYLPTCIARATGDDDVPRDLSDLCAAAGIGLEVPESATSLCCGQPFASKGLRQAHRQIAERTAEALLALGRDVVVTDTSTCAAQLATMADALPPTLAKRWSAIRIVDPAGFAARELLPRLQGRLSPAAGRIVLHPTCSEQKRGWDGDLLTASRSASASVSVPGSVGCCGMAGDRGWLVPELTASATVREAHAARDSGAPTGACTSTLCAQAMSAATGLPYRHLWGIMRRALSDRDC